MGLSKSNEQSRYKDGFAAVPIELFKDRALRGDDFAMYACMKSFGEDSRAKVETYGARLAWPDQRVKASQRRLEKAGWIVLLSEGRRVSRTIYKPRQWWVCWSKGEQPAQPEEVGDTKIGPPTFRPPYKKAPLKVGSPKNGGAELDKALKTDKAFKTYKERVKEQSNSEKSKTPLSSVSPTPPTPQAALALMNPAYRAKHKQDLDPSSADQAAAAAAVYGEDLVPSWAAFVADPGTRGRMDELRHPIPIFTSQRNLWRRKAGAGVDPAKQAAALAARAQSQQRQQLADDKAAAAAEWAAATWKRLPQSVRDQALDQVAALSGFMADMVEACRRKRQGLFDASSAICAAVMELRPDLVAKGGEHG